MPFTPNLERASLTSSTLWGRTIASIRFIFLLHPRLRSSTLSHRISRHSKNRGLAAKDFLNVWSRAARASATFLQAKRSGHVP